MGTFNLLLMVALVMPSGGSEPESAGFDDASTEQFDEHLQRRLALAQCESPQLCVFASSSALIRVIENTKLLIQRQ